MGRIHYQVNSCYALLLPMFYEVNLICLLRYDFYSILLWKK